MYRMYKIWMAHHDTLYLSDILLMLVHNDNEYDVKFTCSSIPILMDVNHI